jgi:hypothetical protein
LGAPAATHGIIIPCGIIAGFIIPGFIIVGLIMAGFIIAGFIPPPKIRAHGMVAGNVTGTGDGLVLLSGGTAVGAAMGDEEAALAGFGPPHGRASATRVGIILAASLSCSPASSCSQPFPFEHPSTTFAVDIPDEELMEPAAPNGQSSSEVLPNPRPALRGYGCVGLRLGRGGGISITCATPVSAVVSLSIFEKNF